MNFYPWIRVLKLKTSERSNGLVVQTVDCSLVVNTAALKAQTSVAAKIAVSPAEHCAVLKVDCERALFWCVWIWNLAWSERLNFPCLMEQPLKTQFCWFRLKLMGCDMTPVVFSLWKKDLFLRE